MTRSPACRSGTSVAERLLDDGGRQHQPDRARRLELLDEVPRATPPGAPLVPSASSTLAGCESKTTQACPPRIRRRTMLPPIRPRPIIPSCMLTKRINKARVRLRRIAAFDRTLYVEGERRIGRVPPMPDRQHRAHAVACEQGSTGFREPPLEAQRPFATPSACMLRVPMKSQRCREAHAR